MKMCKRCQQNKFFSEFRVNKNNKYGYSSYCLLCSSEYSKEWHKKNYKNKYAKEKMLGSTKICSLCNEYKPFSDFKNKKHSWCNLCQKEYDRKRNEKSLVNPRKYLDGKIHCRECNQYFAEEKFSLRKGNRSRCDECAIVYQHKRTVKKHGITYERYLEIYTNQGGKCKICKEQEKSYRSRLSIDHDHSCCPGSGSCGKCIRGLLCSNCNTFLGNAKDSIEILKAAIKYLQK